MKKKAFFVKTSRVRVGLFRVYSHGQVANHVTWRRGAQSPAGQHFTTV